jgi:Flp pilus assembly protein TadG
MLPLFLAVVGLAIDGGLVFNARRDLQNVADAAARAGAMQIDEAVYRLTEEVVLDGTRATLVAAEYLEDHGDGRTYRITVEPADTPRRVLVEVEDEIPTAFMRLAGIATVRIKAEAPAEARYGIEQGDQ